MKPLLFTYQDSCQVDPDHLADVLNHVAPETERMQGHITDNESEYAFITAPYNDHDLQAVQAMVDAKKALRPTLLVVVGIGGSNLGTQAIHEFLYGKLYNLQHPAIKVYFADTCDSDYINDIALLVEQELQQKGRVLLNLVSKSGSTTESIANFEVLLAVVAKYQPAYKECVVVTTDEESPLWRLAHQEGFACLTIPKKLGGRYSVFSAVGLFPLGLLGVDTAALVHGARHAITHVLEQEPTNNPALVTAALLAVCYAEQSIPIHNTFVFSPDLEGCGRWYRQLLAESIGKELNRVNQQVHCGITPTVAVGSTDLHSMGQLYLGGPRDTFTSFVQIARNKSDVVVPNYRQYDTLVEHVQQKPLATIMNAICEGTQRAYRNGNRPFVTWTLPEKKEEYIGQWLQYKMFEVVYLGFLLDVNPFDQPEVERYKQETRKILAHE